MPQPRWTWLLPALLAIPLWRWESAGRRALAISAIAGSVVVGVVALKVFAYPVIDRTASARLLAREIAATGQPACVEALHRNWRYGLAYYLGAPLPECDVDPRPVRVTQGPDDPRPRIQ